jgi:hypothetical protein
MGYYYLFCNDLLVQVKFSVKFLSMKQVCIVS